MKRLLAILCAFAIVASGCTYQQDNREDLISLNVYCLETIAPQDVARHLTYEERSFDSGLETKDLVDAVLQTMQKMDINEKAPAIPDGISISNITFYGNNVVVTLSKEFNSLTPIVRSLAAGAIALTLTQINTISYVKITCDDEKNNSANDFYLNGDNIIINDDIIKFNAFDVPIFYVNEKAQKIVKTIKTVKTEQDRIYMNLIFSQLMTSTDNTELTAPVPSGMMLRSIKMNGSVCELDFMDTSSVNVRALGELQLAAIVNTFCLQEGVERVLITINGKNLSHYAIDGYDQPMGYDKSFE